MSDNPIKNFDSLNKSDQHEILATGLSAGIQGACPDTVFHDTISMDGSTLTILGDQYNVDNFDKIVVLGGGKAAGTIALELENILGSEIDRGAIVTNNPTETDIITIHHGSHPIPSQRNVEGTKDVLEIAHKVGRDTLVLVVITGGGSALLCAPGRQISLADLQSVTDEVLASGAPVNALNTLRKHLSRLKGGQLALELSPATVAGIVVSDFVGDDLSVIASGPISPDPSTFDDAISVIDTFEISVPVAVRRRLEMGADGQISETPTAKNPVFNTVHTYVIANSMTAMQAAADHVRNYGYEPLLLTSRDGGEAREIAKVYVSIAEEIAATGHPVTPPAAVIGGGELTVAVRGMGSGGPNQEFVTSASLELTSEKILLGSIDTDGRDGGTKAAGAIVDANTTVSPELAMEALSNNDTYPYLDSLDALVRTGRTGTNVNDLRIVLIDP